MIPKEFKVELLLLNIGQRSQLSWFGHLLFRCSLYDQLGGGLCPTQETLEGLYLLVDRGGSLSIKDKAGGRRRKDLEEGAGKGDLGPHVQSLLTHKKAA